MANHKIITAESFLKEPLKEENIIVLKWKITQNRGAKKSRYNLVNTVATKMMRKDPKENFVIYLKGSNTSLCHIYDKEDDSWIGIPIEDHKKLNKRRYWRKGKRTNKK